MLPPYDPSKMDPKLLMELSQLIQQLPPDQLNKMQTLMHNMMAGFDCHQELAEFEKTLPAGFREKISSLMIGQMTAPPASDRAQTSEEISAEMNVREARMTILRGVAQGSVSPDEAERLLFGD